MKVVIRPPTPEDASDIRRIQAEGWLDNNLSPQTGVTREFLEKQRGISVPPSNIKVAETAKMIREAQGNYFVATVEDNVVGWIMASANKDEVYSFGIYVDRRYRNQGVGTKLMAVFIEHSGGKKMSINVSTMNQDGVRFYEKFGLKVVRPDKHYLNDDKSVYLPTVIMQNYE
ncbi:GNAT family N-acetyltransferase [Candidatus Woesebacteria bacterium]|nr:GNAT family N-acetyltransferase [Candidatus Woesebacteria bacterium]